MLWLTLLLMQAAWAQYEPPKVDPLDELATPAVGEACGYASCLPVKPGWLNVHLVPQTHSELGHGYNFYQHFTGEDPPLPKNTINMKRILDAIVTELWKDQTRRFTLSDTAYLFHWWDNRHPAVRRMMHELVRQGRMTIVGGGLSISDEASTSYHAIIDQFTYSLRKLNDTFRACARPLVAWAADVYGHSREFTSLMAQMGYDALFINPISYDEEVARIRRKALEFLWRGSDDLGPSTDIFTHNLFDGYWAPPGFCFSKMCSDPLLVTSSKVFSDIRDRVDKFIEGVLYRQAPNFETRNVMVIMGHRKAYSDADVWFANIEKLIAFTNWRAHQKKLNVTLFYSSPPCYLAAVHDEQPLLETKQDDFFPYVHDKDSYTVGMYTSRPTFKYLIREAHIYLQMAKQLQITANLGPHTQMFEDFKWVLGVVQDHSVATGVLRHRVKDYYTQKLDAAITNSTEMISRAFTKLRGTSTHVPHYRCQFNISSCVGSRFIKYSVQVYNPLGWPVTTPVRLPVFPNSNKFLVYDIKGEEITSATIKLPDTILQIKDRPKADHEVVFMAVNIPPVGFRSYYVESHFEKGRRTLDVKEEVYDELPSGEDGNTAVQTLWTDNEDSQYKINVLGLDINKTTNKRTVGYDTNVTKLVNDQMLATEVLKGTANNYMKNMIQVEDDNVHDQLESPTEETIRLPMLRDFLQKSQVLNRLDFVDNDMDLLSSNELEKYEATTVEEVEETTAESDIKIPFKKNTTIPDIMVEPDIRISFVRRTTRKPDVLVKITEVTESNESDLKFIYTTTDSDIRVPAKVWSQATVKIVDSGVKKSNHTFIVKTEGRVFKEEQTTESLAIVPVEAARAVTFTDDWPTTDSVLVVPVNKAISESASSEDSRSAKHWVAENIKGVFATEKELLEVNSSKQNVTSGKRRIYDMNQYYFKTNATNQVGEADDFGDNGAHQGDFQEMEHEETRRNSYTTETDTSTYTTEIYTETTAEATTEYVVSSTVGTVNDEKLFVSPLGATRTPPVNNQKYFKVEGGSRLFIGNQYIRVNLDQSKRVASVFLRNGLRINLSIQMFHYVSDDPSRFDIRTVPRRTIKPPGAYIFRPIDPYIIRAEDNYNARIVKTDVVDEMHMVFNNWTSLVLRVYVDSPVIEAHWLVGPIPTEDGFGKDVFIRYQTDLDNDNSFYTDSNGRQTIKRIKGARATYEPEDLNPITGNLYPVTSKISIEDLKKNIRFSVFNDRCQAGGAVIDGAVDLMVHRRILTDDIGFGAFLNETESNEGIRAIGTHYLYFTKANRNRIFEKKFAKEVALAPRVLISDHLMYSDDLRRQFYSCKNEFSALKENLPLGVHLLTLERITKDQILVRFENYLEKNDVTSDGVRFLSLRNVFKDIRVLWLKETLLGGNMYKDLWAPTQWRKKNRFFRRFNDYFGGGNDTLEEVFEQVNDELGGRGIRLAPQQIRTFIVKYEYMSEKAP